MAFSCECEHAAHFDSDKRTPNGNPAHRFAVRFHSLALTKVKTPYGTFNVCPDCQKDCFKEHISEPT